MGRCVGGLGSHPHAGLPPIRLHDLRHGAATLSLAAGTDMKYVSAMLRHSSMGITSDIYTAVLPEMAREAAKSSVALVPRRVAVGRRPILAVSLRSPYWSPADPRIPRLTLRRWWSR